MTSAPPIQCSTLQNLQDSSEDSTSEDEPDADRALSRAIAEAAELAAQKEEGRGREREIQRLATEQAEKRAEIRKNVEAKQAKAALDRQQRDFFFQGLGESFFVDPEVAHAQRSESRAALRTAIQKDSADLAVLRRQQVRVSVDFRCDLSNLSTAASPIEAQQRRQEVLGWLAEYRKKFALRKAANAKE